MTYEDIMDAIADCEYGSIMDWDELATMTCCPREKAVSVRGIVEHVAMLANIAGIRMGE